ncbi:MAG: calcium/sodium antiporter [Cyclobacteriaceae bacterium]|nr:calcium/sodium antiporter [Cyclobacteriaceae bacterium]
MATTITLLIIGLIVLIVGGDYLVKGASSIALRLHLSPLVVGLTIVAFGTSAPELVISIQSAVSGSPDLAMGNVVGSNICNLALVLGLTAVINPVKVQSNSIQVDWPVTMGSALLLYLTVREGFLEFWEGVLFVVLLLLYLVFIIRQSRKDVKAMQKMMDQDDIPDAPSKQIWKDLGFIAIGCLGLYYGSEWFVGSAKELALSLGVEERVVGLTVVALGTSLPELVTACVASYKGQSDLALGNLMGSNIFNILSILGLTSMIQSIPVHVDILNKDIIWMLLITLMILPLMIMRREVGRVDGLILLVVYSIYVYTVVV